MSNYTYKCDFCNMEITTKEYHENGWKFIHHVSGSKCIEMGMDVDENIEPFEIPTCEGKMMRVWKSPSLVIRGKGYENNKIE